ncbi:hypothetical protein [Paenalkalicoccus suaedae]|nr:hypothetical protein [Paenalkalicoccus suaedae]
MLQQGKLEAVAQLNYETWISRGRELEAVQSHVKQLILDMQVKTLKKPASDETVVEVKSTATISRLKNIHVPVLILIGEGA